MKTPLTIADLKSKLGKSFINPKIYCHPNNYNLLLDGLRQQTQEWYGTPLHFIKYDHTFSLDVIKDRYVPEFARKWIFPADRFVEYEKSDEVWAIPIGFGKYVDTKDPVFYVIDQAIFGWNYGYNLGFNFPKLTNYY